MFFISSCVIFLAIVYTWKALEWHTNKEITRILPPCGVKSTFLETLQVVNKPRPKYHTFFLILIIFAMAVYTFQRGMYVLHFSHIDIIRIGCVGLCRLHYSYVKYLFVLSITSV